MQFARIDSTEILLGSTFTFRYLSQPNSAAVPLVFNILDGLHLQPRRLMKRSPGLTIVDLIHQLCQHPYIVLPVHLPEISHWILLIIHNARAFYAGNDAGPPPYILTLDSLHFNNSPTRDKVLAWFKSLIPSDQFTGRPDLVSVDLKVCQLHLFIYCFS